MNNYIKLSIVGLILLGLGYAFGRFNTPTKVETKTEPDYKNEGVEVDEAGIEQGDLPF